MIIQNNINYPALVRGLKSSSSQRNFSSSSSLPPPPLPQLHLPMSENQQPSRSERLLRTTLLRDEAERNSSKRQKQSATRRHTSVSSSSRTTRPSPERGSSPELESDIDAETQAAQYTLGTFLFRSAMISESLVPPTKSSKRQRQHASLPLPPASAPSYHLHQDQSLSQHQIAATAEGDYAEFLARNARGYRFGAEDEGHSHQRHQLFQQHHARRPTSHSRTALASPANPRSMSPPVPSMVPNSTAAAAAAVTSNVRRHRSFRISGEQDRFVPSAYTATVGRGRGAIAPTGMACAVGMGGEDSSPCGCGGMQGTPHEVLLKSKLERVLRNSEAHKVRLAFPFWFSFFLVFLSVISICDL